MLLTNTKLNCWEIVACGYEPGGKKAIDSGTVCPAALCVDANGTNDGTNAGRCCWRILGTLCCSGTQQNRDNIVAKITYCVSCPVYLGIRLEEGANFRV